MENKKLRCKKNNHATEDYECGHIAFLDGRPDRQHPISSDDLINLAITLNTHDCVDEIIAEL